MTIKALGYAIFSYHFRSTFSFSIEVYRLNKYFKTISSQEWYKFSSNWLFFFISVDGILLLCVIILS